MDHFIALMWNPANFVAANAAAEYRAALLAAPLKWQCDVASPGLSTFSPIGGAISRNYVLPNGLGVIYGKCFKTASLGSELILDATTVRSLAAVNGGRLPTDYWGNYVAFLREANGQRCYALRDCSGQIPCFRTHHRGVEIFCSSIRDLVPLALPRFTLNYEYLAASILRDPLHVRDCGLRQVQELLAGDCVEFDLHTSRQFPIWNPRDVCELRTLDNYEQASRLLKETTEECIRAWASTYGHIVLNLSGGLDSAIVLGCLSQLRSTNPITCINHYTSSSGDDERSYARLAAAAAHVELVELNRAVDDRLLDATLALPANDVRPNVPSIIRFLQMDAVNAVVKRVEGDSVWTGQGGDHLFLAAHHALGAADFVTQRGFKPGLLRAVQDSAFLSRHSYWKVLGQAIRLGRSRDPWETGIVAADGTEFVRPEALPKNIDHYATSPWHDSIQGLPKGKISQIEQLSDLLNRHRHLVGIEHVYEQHPLISQPLIELSLQIPTYLLLRGGRQRAMAREVFSDRVPGDIIRREDKGDTSAQMRELIRKSTPFLLDILLDGVLAREKIINRDVIDRLLVRRQPFRLLEMYPLFGCIAAELWARGWEDQRSIRAAA